MPSKIPSVTVDLDLPARERWLAPGVEMAPMVRRLSASVLELASEILPASFHSLLRTGSKSSEFLALLPRQMTEESGGLSEATGIPVGHLILANCLYDFTQLCSAAVYPDRDGKPVMIRYMDWDIPDDLARHTVLTKYVRSGNPCYSSLGFAGFLGVVTALSPEWALAMNQAPAARASRRPLSPSTIRGSSPATFAVRRACDQARSHAELRDTLLRIRSWTPFLTLTCGTRPGQISRIERPSRGRASLARARVGNSLCLTNHYQHRDHLRFNDDAPPALADGDCGDCDFSVERLEGIAALAARFSGSERLPSPKDLRRSPMFWDCTVHTAVMRPATGEFRYQSHDRS